MPIHASAIEYNCQLDKRMRWILRTAGIFDIMSWYQNTRIYADEGMQTCLARQEIETTNKIYSIQPLYLGNRILHVSNILLVQKSY